MEKVLTPVFTWCPVELIRARFQPGREAPAHDLILTGRLVEIKRIDVFLQAIKSMVQRIPDISAVIVGDGNLRDQLQGMAVDLGVDCHVTFVGHQENVEAWLRQEQDLCPHLGFGRTLVVHDGGDDVWPAGGGLRRR